MAVILTPRTTPLKHVNIPDDILEHPELRDEAIGGLASRVSVHPEVRAALNKRQVDFATNLEALCLTGATSEL